MPVTAWGCTDAIDELPMTRLHRFNKMLLRVERGRGVEHFGRRHAYRRVTRYLALGKTREAQTGLSNMRQNIYMVLSGISTRHLALRRS